MIESRRTPASIGLQARFPVPQGAKVDVLLTPGTIVQRGPAMYDKVLFPGSFNPFHEGHAGIAGATHAASGRTVVFEIGKSHPFKASLSESVVHQRAMAFPPGELLLVTEGLPRIVDKIAALTPLAGVVMGADTLERFIDTQYYPEVSSLSEFLNLCRESGLTIYVFDRRSGGKTLSLESVVPDFRTYDPLFKRIEGSWDVSSSEIRARLAPHQQSLRQQIYLDRARGMLVGSALGDALGLPVETLTPEQISSRYGRIIGFESPKDNPFTNGLLTEPGSTSDDFQLTCAVAEAVTRTLAQKGATVSAEDFLEMLGECHLAEYRRSSVGWGGSTIAGVKELEAAGSVQSLLSQQRHRPKAEGNGVAMKIAPLALLELRGVLSPEDMERVIYGAGAITHPSAMGVASGFAQVAATKYCLQQTVDTFVPDDFIGEVVSAAKNGEGYFPKPDVRLSDGLSELSTLMHASPAEIVQRCGGGSAYVYHSLPFSYAFFLKNYRSGEPLFEVVNAGGDTDSNGAIVGTLLGALHGEAIFPTQLTQVMPSVENVVRHAQQLAERLVIALHGDEH